MKFSLRSSYAVCIMVCTLWGALLSPECSSAEAAVLLEDKQAVSAGPSLITKTATCGEWASWVPPRTDPALVMQVVSESYVDLQRNFMRLMELNSDFTRHHLYLMCMDDASVGIFAALGIRCVPLGALEINTIHDVWRTRVRALSCLVMEGYDVIMSDSDALWLGDPMDYFSLPAVQGSSVVASRGDLPFSLGLRWGSTMCLGFIFFRATGPGMDKLQKAMEQFVLRIGDDQIAANKVLNQLGVSWDEDSDMRLVDSTSLGRGTIETLRGDDGDDGPFVVTLLPHNAFTRQCDSTPISNETVVAHCHSRKRVGKRVFWMEEANLWLVGGNDS